MSVEGEECQHPNVYRWGNCVDCGEQIGSRGRPAVKVDELPPYQESPKELPTCRSILSLESIELTLPPESTEDVTNVDLEADFDFYVWQGHRRRSRSLLNRRWHR